MIPFVALGVYLLRQETGRLGMITSSTIEQVPFASRLRNFILESCRIDEISFFPQMKLFEDAAVANTVFFLTKIDAKETDLTLRRWHSENVDNVTKDESLSQRELGEKIFRQIVQSENFSDTTSLKEICYISVGMAAQADEKRFKGKFTKDDLFLKSKTKIIQ